MLYYWQISIVSEVEKIHTFERKICIYLSPTDDFSGRKSNNNNKKECYNLQISLQIVESAGLVKLEVNNAV